MNERLKELMLEAGYAAPEMAGRANKLAELIVLECAEFIHQSDLLCSDEWDFAERDLPSTLKQHFGVK
jgi:hypothetical protein